jgi:hypothetical protein
MELLIQSLITGLFVGLLGWWTNRRLERWKGDLQSEMDTVVRRREIYDELAPWLLKVFSRQGLTHQERTDFARAYARAYIWAPDEVLETLDSYLDRQLVREGGRFVGTVAENESAFEQIMLRMRKDAGHADTKIKYRPAMRVL